MNLKSGYPFFLIQNGLPHDYPKLMSDAKTDVAILGGGISGALAAYNLVNAGVECMLIDGRTIGLGSTCASTSLLQYEIDTPLSKLIKLTNEKTAVRSYELCAEAIDKLRIIANDTGLTAFEDKKSLYYAASKKDLSFLKEEFEARKKYGFEVKYLEAENIESDFHFKAPGAILSSKAAQTNAYLFTHSLLQAAIAKGLKVYDRSNVNAIKHTSTSVTLATESGQTIKAKKLIYATGYEAVKYIHKKIVNLNSTFACISEQSNTEIQRPIDDVLIWNTADPYLYIRTTKDKRILIGGRDEKFYNPEKRDKMLLKKTRELTKDFKSLFPQKEFKPEFSWAGTFGATKDGLPYIGAYDQLPNSYFALGFGGNGITFSLIAAEIITDLIKGKKNKDVAHFSFKR